MNSLTIQISRILFFLTLSTFLFVGLYGQVHSHGEVGGSEAQVQPGDFNDKIKNTPYIFEGVVVDQAYYRDSVFDIATAYQVEILHVFKGEATLKLGTVTLLQRGGYVGMEFSKPFHQQRYGEKGRFIFFCSPTKAFYDQFDSQNSKQLHPNEAIVFCPQLNFPYAVGLDQHFDSHEAVYEFLKNFPELIIPEHTLDPHPYEHTRAQEIQKMESQKAERELLKRQLREQKRKEKELKRKRYYQQLDSSNGESHPEKIHNQGEDSLKEGNDVGHGLIMCPGGLYNSEGISSSNCGRSVYATDSTFPVRVALSSNSKKARQRSELLARYGRYKERYKFYKKLAREQHQNHAQKGAEEVTFTIANLRLDNSALREIEFDIMIRGNNSSNYFDNALFRIQYDTRVFGTNAVANGTVLITRGSSFNNSTYNDPDLDVIDENDSTLGIPFGVDFNATSLNRAAVTTFSQQLLHVEIELNQCVDPSLIQFVDTAFTPIFSFYTTTPSAPIVNASPYDNTFYQGTPAIVNCAPVITNFTPTVYPGTYYPGTPTSEWELRIEGSNFGEFSDVFFPDGDDTNIYTYIDDEDYLLWSDSLVVIRMPSIIKNNPPGMTTIPSSGRFYLVNAFGDTIFSNPSIPLKMPFAINNGLLPQSQNKRRFNLADINGIGGYTFLIDSSITNYPDPALEASIRKSIYEWSCSTGVNFQIEETVKTGDYAKDGFSMIFLKDSLLNPNAYGSTIPYGDFCIDPTTGDTLIYVTDIDIGFRRVPAQNVTWNFDTTGAALPANQGDFFKVALHEVGHGTTLMHTNNLIDDDLMFKGQNTGPATASQRLYTLTQGPLNGVFNMMDRSTTLQYSTGCLYSPFAHVETFPAGCSARGINDPFSNTRTIEVFPNPAMDQLWVDLKDVEGESEILLMDFNGKVFQKEIAPRGSAMAHLSVPEVPGGVYLVRLMVQDQVFGYNRVVILR